MENKFNSYFALAIGVFVYIVGVVIFVLKSFDRSDYTASFLYMFSTSTLSLAIFTKIENNKLFKITAISQMVISWLYIIGLGLNDLDNAKAILLISITALYFAFYSYIKKRTKEESEYLFDEKSDEDEDNEDENPYWMEGAENLDDHIKDKRIND